MRQLQLLHQQALDPTFSSPKAELAHLSKRWRQERNMWMAAFAFSAWV